jgi:hypothetical protein
MSDRTLYNIYCDESCHLENDKQKAMVLGGISCPAVKARPIADAVRAIKRKHGYKDDFEIKWVNVTKLKLGFYTDLVEYFFNEPVLRFRAVVIPDKSILDHERFRQTHDDWYYKMYYELLTKMIDPEQAYRIYLDIKDTRSVLKAEKLRQVLANTYRDRMNKIIQRVQHVRSHEIEQVQLVDLLIGAVGYENRGLSGNEAKVAMVDCIQGWSSLTLKTTTPMGGKVDILIWDPSRGTV